MIVSSVIVELLNKHERKQSRKSVVLVLSVLQLCKALGASALPCSFDEGKKGIQCVFNGTLIEQRMPTLDSASAWSLSVLGKLDESWVAVALTLFRIANA